MSLSLCKHVYENNTHVVRLLSSLSVLQFTIMFEAQDSLGPLQIVLSFDGPDLCAFISPGFTMLETQEEATLTKY